MSQLMYLFYLRLKFILFFDFQETGDDKEPPQKKAKKTLLAFDEDEDDNQEEFDEEGEDESETVRMTAEYVSLVMCRSS